MQLPDFLIIGSMKAGTTTLYRDPLTNPQIFFPRDKEPGNLPAVTGAKDKAILGGIYWA